MHISNIKNNGLILAIYRIINQVFNPYYSIRGLMGYFWFMGDLLKFRKLSKIDNTKAIDFYPRLHEKTKTTTIDHHYFHQQIWCFEQILQTKPNKHVDIGSTYEMSGYISKITQAEFVDIRPIETSLKNLSIVNADITNLPYRDSSIDSLSCLHVIEHIGLGRYGDKVDPDGHIKAINEIQRVSKNLIYISTPVGKSRICFNAHRIFDPEHIKELFHKSKLISFSMVDDLGNFKENCDIHEAKEQKYSCGMYIFKKI